MCAKLATHFKLKTLQFKQNAEMDFLKVLMKEGKNMPKKF